jgi:hypothetical protein
MLPLAPWERPGEGSKAGKLFAYEFKIHSSNREKDFRLLYTRLSTVPRPRRQEEEEEEDEDEMSTNRSWKFTSLRPGSRREELLRLDEVPRTRGRFPKPMHVRAAVVHAQQLSIGNQQLTEFSAVHKPAVGPQPQLASSFFQIIVDNRPS